MYLLTSLWTCVLWFRKAQALKLCLIGMAQMGKFQQFCLSEGQRPFTHQNQHKYCQAAPRQHTQTLHRPLEILKFFLIYILKNTVIHRIGYMGYVGCSLYYHESLIIKFWKGSMRCCIFASFLKGKRFIFVHQAAQAYFNDYSPMLHCTSLWSSLSSTLVSIMQM